MKVIVLGGYGGMSRPTVKDLLESTEVSKVVVADILIKETQKYVAGFGDSRVSAEYADCNDRKGLVKLFKKGDLVINGTLFNFNIEVMRAALEAGIHYLDLGGLFHITRKQLELSNEFEKAGLLAVVGMGSGPGTSNLMARYAVDRLDKVESIKFRIASKNFTKSKSPLVTPYAISTFLEEFTMNPIVFEDGEFKEVPPLSGLEKIIYPEPVGEAEPMYTLHSEVATPPVVFKDKGLKHVSFKIAFPPEFVKKLRFLIDLGFASKESIQVKNVSVKPSDFLMSLLAKIPSENNEPEDYGVHRVIVKGEKDGKSVEYVMEMAVKPPGKEWGSGVAFRTGVPPSIVAQMILKGEVAERGVLPPEACIDTKIYFEELAKRDMHVFANVTEHV